MKSFYIYPLGEDYPILVKGNYSAYIRSLEKGEFKTFCFETVENSFKKMIIKAADDRYSNQGDWYAHCNGYNMNLMITKSGSVIINTYTGYRTVSISPKKSWRYGF